MYARIVLSLEKAVWKMVYTVESLALRPEFDIVPDWFWDQIPTECPYCGLETSMQLNLTKLQCIDPRCRGKVAKRTETLLKDMGIKGLGEAGVRKFIDEYDLVTPFGLFALRGENSDGEKFDYPLFDGVNSKVDGSVKNEIDQVKKRGLRLWEVVKMMHIPYVGEKSSKRLFGSYNTIEDFYNAKGEGITALDFVREKLGIQADGNDISLQSVNVNDSLDEFKEDLEDAERTFGNILKVELDENGQPKKGIKGVYTDKRKTDLASTKKEFYLLVQDSFPLLNIEWESSVTKDVDFVISGTGNRTSKLVKAEKYGIPVFFDENELFDKLAEVNDGGSFSDKEDPSDMLEL